MDSRCRRSPRSLLECMDWAHLDWFVPFHNILKVDEGIQKSRSAVTGMLLQLSFGLGFFYGFHKIFVPPTIAHLSCAAWRVSRGGARGLPRLGNANN